MVKSIIDEIDTEPVMRGPNSPSPELTLQFTALVEEGLPFDMACDYLGIPTSTFSNWCRRGKVYNSCPTLEQENYRVYGDFELALRKAAANYYLKLVRRAHDEKNPHWKRELEILERRDKKNFSKFDMTGGMSQTEVLDGEQRYN